MPLYIPRSNFISRFKVSLEPSLKLLQSQGLSVDDDPGFVVIVAQNSRPESGVIHFLGPFHCLVAWIGFPSTRMRAEVEVFHLIPLSEVKNEHFARDFPVIYQNATSEADYEYRNHC
jgi:hypothetical protein